MSNNNPALIKLAQEYHTFLNAEDRISATVAHSIANSAVKYCEAVAHINWVAGFKKDQDNEELIQEWKYAAQRAKEKMNKFDI